MLVNGLAIQGALCSSALFTYVIVIPVVVLVAVSVIKSGCVTTFGFAHEILCQAL